MFSINYNLHVPNRCSPFFPLLLPNLEHALNQLQFLNINTYIDSFSPFLLLASPTNRACVPASPSGSCSSTFGPRPRRVIMFSSWSTSRFNTRYVSFLGRFSVYLGVGMPVIYFCRHRAVCHHLFFSLTLNHSFPILSSCSLHRSSARKFSTPCTASPTLRYAHNPFLPSFLSFAPLPCFSTATHRLTLPPSLPSANKGANPSILL